MRPLVSKVAKAALPPALWQILRRRRVQRRIESFPARTVVHTYGGQPLRVAIRDELAAGWYDHDWPRQPEIDLLTNGRLREGATVFDIGAHQGVVALMLAREVGPTGTVVAVEAEPHNVRVARLNCALNGARNVHVIAAAIAAESGHLYFTEGLNGKVIPGVRAGKVRVEAVTIDELADRYGVPDVVFLDVEGYEGHALRGAAKTLSNARTDFFIELHDAEALEAVGDSASAVLQHFVDAQYSLFLAPAPEGAASGNFRPLDDHASNGQRCYIVGFGPDEGSA